MACESLKDSLKMAIFLEHQKSWGQRVEIYSTDYQEMTWDSHHERKIKGKSYFYSQLHLVAEKKVVFGYRETWPFEESSIMTWLVISLQHYH